MRGGAFILLALLTVLAACGSHDDHAGGHLQPSADIGPLYSPNGEPLSGGPLGHPTCQDALAAWFDRVDAKHAGTIDLAAFLADANRQYAAMDLNHDGEITPDELARYRAAYMAELRMAEAGAEDDTLRPDQSAAPPSRPGGGRGSGRGGGSGGAGGRDPNAGGATNMSQTAFDANGGHKGDADPNPLDLARDRPDPVMIADVTLRNRVTLAEFLAYARQNFAELDANRDGRLSKDELIRSCPSAHAR